MGGVTTEVEVIPSVVVKVGLPRIERYPGSTAVESPRRDAAVEAVRIIRPRSVFDAVLGCPHDSRANQRSATEGRCGIRIGAQIPRFGDEEIISLISISV